MELTIVHERRDSTRDTSAEIVLPGESVRVDTQIDIGRSRNATEVGQIVM